MLEYDVIVVGSGAGMNVAARARQEGMRVALVESAPLGGTCLNKGCIPSKILIHPADVIREVQHASTMGIHADITNIDFGTIYGRMREHVDGGRKSMEKGTAMDKGLDLYTEKGSFTAPLTIKSGGDTIQGKKVIVGCGVRPRIPDVPGLKETGFLTSETIFDMRQLPESIVIIGGGYIGCEFSHFFSAMGTKVHLIGRSDVLLPQEEPEASALITGVMSRFVDLKTGCDAVGVSEHGGMKRVAFKNLETDERETVEASEILVAAGVRSNADILNAESGGIKLDSRGYVIVNEFLETSAPNVWALGDVTGRNMFRHTANYESQVVWNNAFHTKKVKLDEHAVPHAVFTHPQVASVGLTQAQAKKQGRKVLVGLGSYDDCAMGFAMAVEESLVKVIVDGQSMKLLGATIVGPEAAVLLQPFVYLMNAGDGSFYPIARSQIIHPALSEAVVGALNDLHDPDEEKHTHKQNHNTHKQNHNTHKQNHNTHKQNHNTNKQNHEEPGRNTDSSSRNSKEHHNQHQHNG